MTCSLERSWIPPTPNLSPNISLYWIGWCSYCSHKVFKYKCPGHLKVVSRPKVIVSNSPSWLSSHLILLSDPWERQCRTKCRGWSNPLKHLNIKEQLVCCEQNSFWLLHPPPHQPAPSCRDGSWIVQTGETGFNQKEVETGSMGGATGCIADCPAMSFVLVCWHSRKWWPSIRGGLLKMMVLLLEKLKCYSLWMMGTYFHRKGRNR